MKTIIIHNTIMYLQQNKSEQLHELTKGFSMKSIDNLYFLIKTDSK